MVLALGSGGVARAAAPGTLDSSFGSGGVAALGSGTQLFGVAVQGDGSVVAAGQSGGSVLVERLSAAGQPGSSFVGSAGAARAVALQPDGKIVVAGAAGGMFVRRFSAGGSPDPSFASGGSAVAPLGGSAVGNAVAVQPDGKIVVAGSVVPSDPSRGTLIALARFNANGSLDTSFGSSGAEVVDFGLPYAAAQGVAVQPDGKVVFVGYEQGSPTYAFFNGLVGRLNSNGSLDASFAGSGVYSYHKAGGGYDSFNAVVRQNNGKIVAAGADVESDPFALFLRLNSDGTPDSSFGSSGVATLSSGNNTSTPVGAYGVGIAGGGRVVGTGAVQLNGTDFRAGLWASSPAGSPDPSFGSSGIVEQQTGAEACALAIAPDGSLLAVGGTVAFNRSGGINPCTVNSTSSAFVARYVGYGPAPVAPRPSVSTAAASAITEVSATVSGQVNPNGVASTYHFDYGTTTAYGSSTPTAKVGSGTSLVGVSASLTGLHAGTTYHYRITATNSAGTNTGTDATFTTAPSVPGTAPPTVTTGAASAVTEVSANVRGQVDSNGLAASYHMEYGHTTAYGSSTPTAKVGSGTSLVGVSASLTGLHAGTTYHYRLVASNVAGAAYGADRSFTTAPPLRTALHRLAGSYRISKIIKNGLLLSVGCSQGCAIKGSLLISAGTAKRLGISSRQIAIGSGSASLKRGGTARLRLTLTRAAKHKLANTKKKVSLTLRILTSPAGGGRAVTVTKTLTFKR
jgi:uncharacterized delta-60 repeat protein